MLDADGAAAMEGLRAELPRAKEQARRSDAATSKAAEELKAEKAAQCRSREEMAEMAMKLRDATDLYEVLERERQAEQEDLKKATAEAKDARSAMRAINEELRQAGDIAAGKPFLPLTPRPPSRLPHYSFWPAPWLEQVRPEGSPQQRHYLHFTHML